MFRRILYFWAPLFASWLLMTTEGPLLSAIINRRPDEVVMLAALGVAFAVAVTVESPIINLLSTSTALVRDLPSYRVTRRFTVHWMVLLTLVGGVIAFGPLFDLVVGQLLGTPPEIARWVRPGLQILVLWTPAIAWRRFLQGILIRFGQPRAVARGTVLRLVGTAGTAFGLAVWTGLPGIHIGAWAMLAGVIIEAIYATVVAAPVIAALPEEPRRPLDYRRLFYFHLPLAGTAVLTLAAQPMVTFTLARLERPELSLAAWPLVFQALLALRAASLALPEVVIALADEPGARGELRRFSGLLAAVFLGLMALLVLTPALRWYLFGLQDADPLVADLAWWALALCLPLPAIAVVVSWFQGLLIHIEETQAVNTSTVIQLLVLAAGLGFGMALRAPGLVGAVVAMQVSMLAQGAYMAWALNRAPR